MHVDLQSVTRASENANLSWNYVVAKLRFDRSNDPQSQYNGFVPEKMKTEKKTVMPSSCPSAFNHIARWFYIPEASFMVSSRGFVSKAPSTLAVMPRESGLHTYQV
jgi:hypothetical protein